MDIANIQKNIRKASDVLDTVDDFVNDKEKPQETKIEKIIDKNWITGMFMLKGEDLDSVDEHYRYYTTTNLKFTDTSLGGNIGINARPQFTRYADTRLPGRLVNRNKVSVGSMSGNHGMGIYYSEAIDDNAQTVFMQFGVPEFNSLFKFFTRAIDYKTSVIANTGRSPIMYDIGSAIGAVAMFIAFPIPSIAIYSLKYLSNALFGTGSFDYYYFKPTMHLYWSTVSSIATMLAIEIGILSATVMDDKKQSRDKIGVPIKLNQTDLEFMRKVAPDLITDANYIDVFAIANKTQLIANQKLANEKALLEKVESAGVEDIGTYLLTKYNKEIYHNNGQTGFSAWLGDVLSLDKLYGKHNKPKEETTEPNTTTKVDKKITDKINDDGTITIGDKNEQSYLGQFLKYYEAAMKGGGQFATFKVDYVGTVTESFSNSIKDIPTNGMIKTVSGKGRDVKFTLGGGNLVDGLGSIVTAATDMAAGTIDSATFGLSNVLTTVLGGAYMDIPKMWDDSNVDFPKLNFTMQLISPYANPIAQYQNIYLPLSMLLAGAVPLATGRASYTSPYLCTMFLKGMQHIELGIITDLTITRGTSNLGFNKQSKALAIDVSFSVADLSSLIAAPVNTDFTSPLTNIFDDSSKFSRYIATLGSRDLKSSIYSFNKSKIRFSRKHLGLEAVTSPSFWGDALGTVDSSLLRTVMSGYSTSLNFQN